MFGTGKMKKSLCFTGCGEIALMGVTTGSFSVKKNHACSTKFSKVQKSPVFEASHSPSVQPVRTRTSSGTRVLRFGVQQIGCTLVHNIHTRTKLCKKRYNTCSRRPLNFGRNWKSALEDQFYVVQWSYRCKDNSKEVFCL